jgi:hypothetical protein
MVLLSIAGVLACWDGSVAKRSVEDAEAAARIAPASAGPPRAERKPECVQCALEDRRQAAHRDQIVVVARFLGIQARWLDGLRTRQRCTRDDEVIGVARFELVEDNPWRATLSATVTDRKPSKLLNANLPCPELSRPQYAELYRYDPDDLERDGLGHAPILRPGARYRLTFVRDLHIAMREPSHPASQQASPTLVAVNPL